MVNIEGVSLNTLGVTFGVKELQYPVMLGNTIQTFKMRLEIINWISDIHIAIPGRKKSLQHENIITM